MASRYEIADLYLADRGKERVMNRPELKVAAEIQRVLLDTSSDLDWLELEMVESGWILTTSYLLPDETEPRTGVITFAASGDVVSVHEEH